MNAMREFLLLMWLVFVAACSSAHTLPEGDAGIDASAADSAVDVGVDSEMDAPPIDSGFDSAEPMDATLDAAMDAADACVPDCGGLTCGDDGCGGACGPVCTAGGESFEGFPVGPTFPPPPFVFASGLVLTAPPLFSQAAVFHCADGTGFYGFLCADSASLIPDGESLLLMDGLINREKLFAFRFPGLVKSVSVAVTDTTGTEDELFQMEAFDASGALVGSDSIISGPVTSWTANRLSIVVATPMITRITMFSDRARVLSMDDMRWE